MLFHRQEGETTQHLTPSALSTVSLPETKKCMILKKIIMISPYSSLLQRYLSEMIKRTLGFINFKQKLEIPFEKSNGLSHSI